MRVLILDQFSEPSPHALQQRPRRFDDLCAEKLAEPKQWYSRARVEDVVDPETFKVPMCTTIYKADERGYAELWRARWDSSG